MGQCCICGMKDDGIILDYNHSKLKVCKLCGRYKSVFYASRTVNESEKASSISYFSNIVERNKPCEEVCQVMWQWSPDILVKNYTEEQHQVEIKKQEYAKSFNEYYEYDVVTVLNANHGLVDRMNMLKILNERAKEGWKLHTVYSNELGKNALSVLGYGTNSTACEDVLIFERRIPEIK